MGNILNEIMSYLVGGISTLGQGIATGVGDFAKALFLETTGTGSDAVTKLSTFGVLVCIFAGIGFAVGSTRLVFGWIKSLGAR